MEHSSAEVWSTVMASVSNPPHPHSSDCPRGITRLPKGDRQEADYAPSLAAADPSSPLAASGDHLGVEVSCHGAVLSPFGELLDWHQLRAYPDRHGRPPGTSAGSSRPCRRQPTVRSHVRARETGEGSARRASVTVGVVPASRRQPSNHFAEEAGSSTAAMVRAAFRSFALACFRAFSST